MGVEGVGHVAYGDPMKTWQAVVPVLLFSCGTAETTEDDVCAVLCEELVVTCSSEAYPDRTSCLQGCGWDAEIGEDIAGLSQCVTDAACDPFAIVECARAQ